VSADTKIEAQVWVKAGSVSKGDILAQALLDSRDQIPAATLPAAEITDSKATKRDGEQGRLYTVEISFHALKAGESTVSVEDLVADLQPEPFNPDDHHDEA
jgi:hypothetical protein